MKSHWNYITKQYFGADPQVSLQMIVGSHQITGAQGCYWEELRQVGDMGWQEPWSSGQANTKSCTWFGITPCNRTGWGMAVRKGALLKSTWGSWWTTAICPCCKVSHIQDWISKRSASRARDFPPPFGICKTTSGVYVLFWALQDTKDMDVMEQVQWKATKTVTGLKHRDRRTEEAGRAGFAQRSEKKEIWYLSSAVSWEGAEKMETSLRGAQ